MEGVRGCIEFLANIVRALGIVFFLYEFSKDRKEAQEKLKDEEQRIKDQVKLEKRDFKLTRKFIYQNALARIDLSKEEFISGKLIDVMYGNESNNFSIYPNEDIKLVAIKDSLANLKDEILSSLSIEELEYPFVFPDGTVEEQHNETIKEYMNRINSVEKIIQEICNTLFEESLKYRNFYNNTDIIDMLDKIYTIKAEVDKRSLEENYLLLDENSKIEFLISKTKELTENFNEALEKSKDEKTS